MTASTRHAVQRHQKLLLATSSSCASQPIVIAGNRTTADSFDYQ